MGTSHNHRWQFFRAGGFDQVQLDTPADLAALRSLDQKLWATLACPTHNLELDQRMLGYIDSNGDGRIRAPEVLDAVDWTLARLADPQTLFRDEPLTLTSFSEGKESHHLVVAARRLLQILGREESQGLDAADTDDLKALFPPAEPNGDGLVPATLTEDADLQAAIADIISCMGAETDRSGEAAVSEASINGFFEQAQQVQAWQQQSLEHGVQSLGPDAEAAISAIGALREKIDDYFTRVEMVAFDPRAASIMNADEAELVRLSALNLADSQEVAALPLASLQHGEALPLDKGINPAWRGAMRALREHVVRPQLGDVDSITREQWHDLTARCNAYFAWQAAKPAVDILQTLDVERIVWLVEQGMQARLLDLVAKDLEVAEAADGLVELDKLLRLQRGLLTLLRNFVSFYDFYSRKHKAIFQAGRLFIDGRSCDLVVEVADVEAHSQVAANSDSFLLYCACTRRGQPVRERESLNIVAAVTAGGEEELLVGRNGLFYDREGNDWDATVVKVVQNAISVREAFWSPYRRISRLVSDQIQKLAASRDSELVNSSAARVGSGPEAAAEAGAASKTFDIAKFAGIFAAIGLAVGALGAAMAAIFSGLLSLQWWQWPLVLAGVLLAISGPSMLMAWFKLRRRNLGPILDANGWAVNTQARISIGFGTTLTQLACLPQNSARSLRDPYSRERRLWPWLLAVLAIVSLVFCALYFGWFSGLQPTPPE
ncbi:hypothetical protein [Pseudomonas sp. MYb185]|uniref:hypothetical protein n=1 Tax=Pseudomonas sp. MYb185 TaxID=1848729 RepID=UPI000CFB9BA0|nr:hypothetical protein [Pseudomonas sp. MYb185]PRB80554.1 hypothetical protein CQ007_12615 [Pseudomonas sp. MYb185]